MRLEVLAIGALAVTTAGLLEIGVRPAAAVDGTVTFGATLTGSCVLNILSAGTLMPNTAYDALSSKTAGALSGTVAAVVTATGFTVEVIDPTAFTQAPAGTGTPNFAASMTGSGATSISATASGTTRTLSLGTTTLTVDLDADLGGAVFPTGVYSAEVVVRCQ